jgi:hypothetical protein
MSKQVKIQVKDHRVGISEDGAMFELAAGEIIEVSAEEADRMAKAGAGKIVTDKSKQ